jgi:hypothetical protein
MYTKLYSVDPMVNISNSYSDETSIIWKHHGLRLHPGLLGKMKCLDSSPI